MSKDHEKFEGYIAGDDNPRWSQSWTTRAWRSWQLTRPHYSRWPAPKHQFR